MKNILLLYGQQNKIITDLDFFDKIYTLQTGDKYIYHQEMKHFFKEQLISSQEDDNLYVIYNNLIIDNKFNKEFLNKVDEKILSKNKFCYLWNYMQKCTKLNKVDNWREISFYDSANITEFYSVAANIKTWYNILLNKDVYTPMHLLLEEKLNIEIVFTWPSYFSFPLDDMGDNYLIASLCQENFNGRPLKPYNNTVAKIYFILTISIVAIFFYFFYHKIPRPRYFHLKKRS